MSRAVFSSPLLPPHSNKTTERIFPEVPEVESPEFWVKMDRLVELNTQLIALGSSGSPFAKLPLILEMASNVAGIWFMAPKSTGTVDLHPEVQTQF